MLRQSGQPHCLQMLTVTVIVFVNCLVTCNIILSHHQSMKNLRGNQPIKVGESFKEDLKSPINPFFAKYCIVFKAQVMTKFNHHVTKSIICTNPDPELHQFTQTNHFKYFTAN